MTRIIHISDVHFGRDREELVAPLTACINRLAPDLVALSGDLTQRARVTQFTRAAAFLAAIRAPVLVVPGNHDVPLHNFFWRMVAPYRNYRRLISRDLAPSWSDGEVVVEGLNTVRPRSVQRGKFRPGDMTRVCRAFSRAPEAAVRIVVAHHPLEHPVGLDKDLPLGTTMAIDRLSGCGMDMILTGHLHTWQAQPFAIREGHRSPLQVHAGTGLSNRNRGEANDFNLITVSRDRIEVERHAVEEGQAFVPVSVHPFRRVPDGWAPA